MNQLNSQNLNPLIQNKVLIFVVTKVNTDAFSKLV